MRYGVIFVVFLMALCVGQEEVPEQLPEQTQPPEKPVIPDELIQDIIKDYFEALNLRDLDTLKSLTHPYYLDDVQPFVEYVKENNITFAITSVSLLMDQDEFREMTKNMSDEEFAQQVGKRGISYEIELSITQKDETYEEFFLFVELGETDDGWKILDPYLLQLLIESELEVFQEE